MFFSFLSNPLHAAQSATSCWQHSTSHTFDSLVVRLYSLALWLLSLTLLLQSSYSVEHKLQVLDIAVISMQADSSWPMIAFHHSCLNRQQNLSCSSRTVRGFCHIIAMTWKLTLQQLPLLPMTCLWTGVSILVPPAISAMIPQNLSPWSNVMFWFQLQKRG